MNGWLTGEVVQDHANASSTLLYDLRARALERRARRHAGLDAERLPAIRPATAVIGTLRAEVAEALGLSPPLPVIVGTGDDHAGARRRGRAGAGRDRRRHRHGRAGRGAVARGGARRRAPDRDPRARGRRRCCWSRTRASSPAAARSWWAATQGIPQAELFGARRAGAARHRRRAVPARRCPARPRRAGTSRMRGCFAGLALNHDAAHLARAVLEGCALRAARHRRPLRGARSSAGEEIRVVGGGARSRAVAADQGRRHGPPGAAGARRVRDEHGRGDAGGRRRRRVRATSARPPTASVELAAEPVLPRAEHRGVYDDGYGAYRRLFDGVEGALGMSLVPPPSAPTSRATSAALRERLAACDGGGRAAPARARRPAARRRACSTSIADVVAEVRRRDGDVVLLADRREMAGAARRGQGVRRRRAGAAPG